MGRDWLRWLLSKFIRILLDLPVVSGPPRTEGCSLRSPPVADLASDISESMEHRCAGSVVPLAALWQSGDDAFRSLYLPLTSHASIR